MEVFIDSFGVNLHNIPRKNKKIGLRDSQSPSTVNKYSTILNHPMILSQLIDF